MKPVLTLTAHACERDETTVAASSVSLGDDPRIHDAFARLTGTRAALDAARRQPGQAVAIPVEALIDLEATGPEVASADLLRRGGGRPVPAHRVCRDDAAFLALLTLQDRAFLPNATLSLSLAA